MSFAYYFVYPLPTILARDCINPILSLTESGIGLYPNYINPILSIPFTSR